jgi:DNA-binding response OmpR family regulator
MMVTRLDRPTILYVEDDDDTRPGMRRFLNRHGYHVIISLSEEDALERGSQKRVNADLILIDLGLHSEEVLAAAHRIRAHALGRADIPAVMIGYKYGSEMEARTLRK